MLGGEITFLFAGARLVASALSKILKSKRINVAVFANRDIINDVVEHFGGRDKVNVVASYVEHTMSLDEDDIKRVVRGFINEIERNTRIGDSVIVVFACPLIYVAYFVSMTHHWSRRLIIAQFDLRSKTYHLYDFSHVN